MAVLPLANESHIRLSGSLHTEALALCGLSWTSSKRREPTHCIFCHSCGDVRCLMGPPQHTAQILREREEQSQPQVSPFPNTYTGDYVRARVSCDSVWPGLWLFIYSWGIFWDFWSGYCGLWQIDIRFLLTGVQKKSFLYKDWMCYHSNR